MNKYQTNSFTKFEGQFSHGTVPQFVLRIIPFLFVLFFIFSVGLSDCKAADEDDVFDNLVLVEMKANNQRQVTTEILELDGKNFIPVRAFADLLEIEAVFDRADQAIKFKKPVDNKEVEIRVINRSIRIGDNLLDIKTNPFYYIKSGIYLTDEALLPQELIDEIFGVKTNYDLDNLVIFAFAERLTPIKETKAKASSNSNLEVTDEIIRPDPKKVNIRAIQTSFFSSNRLVETDNIDESTSNLSFGNFLGLNVVSDINGGIYRAGPAFFLSQDEIGFSGVRQTWEKILKEDMGIVLGDTGFALNRVATGGQLFGVKVGSPRSLGLSSDNAVTIEGACGNDSDVLLIVNEQQIAQQFCTEGRYKFSYVPRLVNSNNNYRIVQRNTSGEEITLREDTFNYFSELVPKSQKQWQTFFGTPTINLFSNRTSLGFTQEANGGADNFFPNKVISGGQVQYGLSDRVTVEGVASLDQPFAAPIGLEPVPKGDGFLPNFTNTEFLYGQTGAIGVYARPWDNFGIRFGQGVSNSIDRSVFKQSRNGLGFGSTLDYDWRIKNFSNTGSFFYFSPAYYTSGTSLGNRAGANLSLTGSLGRQFIRLAYLQSLFNLDERSQGGVNDRKRAAFNHKLRLNPLTNIQTNVTYNSSSSDLNEASRLAYTNFIFRKLNRKLTLTFGHSVNQILKGQSTASNELSASWNLGMNYTLGGKYRKQISFSVGGNDQDTYDFFTQGRVWYKDFIYQPSLRFQSVASSSDTLTLINGLFWQTPNGSRIGLEYAVSNTESPAVGTNVGSDSNFDSGGRFQIGGTNRTVNHSLSFNVNTTVGFIDNKPYIATSSESGSIKASVYVDQNKNGKRDSNEKTIPAVKLKVNDEPKDPDASGYYLFTDLVPEVYTVALDLNTLPVTLLAVKDFVEAEVQPGNVTKVDMPVSVDTGLIEGQVILTGITGETVPSGNIAVIAKNEKGEEVSYTYTDDDGYYAISELPPGKYKVQVDELDIKNRNLSFKKSSIDVELELKLDDYIEARDINFEGIKSVFGLD